ncbi:MAG: hypothetical protein AAGF12_42910, partial [Myxococcota bacterium]
QTTIDGIVLEGDADIDIFVASFTSAGALRWARGYAGPGIDDSLAMAVDPRNRLWVVGRFDEAIDFDGNTIAARGDGDIFLVRLDQ